MILDLTDREKWEQIENGIADEYETKRDFTRFGKIEIGTFPKVPGSGRECGTFGNVPDYIFRIILELRMLNILSTESPVKSEIWVHVEPAQLNGVLLGVFYGIVSRRNCGRMVKPARLFYHSRHQAWRSRNGSFGN